MKTELYIDTEHLRFESTLPSIKHSFSGNDSYHKFSEGDTILSELIRSESLSKVMVVLASIFDAQNSSCLGLCGWDIYPKSNA